MNRQTKDSRRSFWMLLVSRKCVQKMEQGTEKPFILPTSSNNEVKLKENKRLTTSATILRERIIIILFLFTPNSLIFTIEVKKLKC